VTPPSAPLLPLSFQPQKTMAAQAEQYERFPPWTWSMFSVPWPHLCPACFCFCACASCHLPLPLPLPPPLTLPLIERMPPIQCLIARNTVPLSHTPTLAFVMHVTLKGRKTGHRMI
jgi:hypothetical protein